MLQRYMRPRAAVAKLGFFAGILGHPTVVVGQAASVGLLPFLKDGPRIDRQQSVTEPKENRSSFNGADGNRRVVAVSAASGGLSPAGLWFDTNKMQKVDPANLASWVRGQMVAPLAIPFDMLDWSHAATTALTDELVLVTVPVVAGERRALHARLDIALVKKVD